MADKTPELTSEQLDELVLQALREMYTYIMTPSMMMTNGPAPLSSASYRQ